ncbi:MAG: helix-turn-helix domain-containing protein [Phycisphaeraceae bacterium]|nr:helix-turn-helix domain-containing protein [Phycisphaeraceae bacterium]
MTLTVSYLTLDPPYRYVRAADFPLWTFGCVLEGPMEIRQGRHRHISEPGSLVVIAPDTPYAISTTPRTRRHREYFAILTIPKGWKRWFARWPSPMPGLWRVNADRVRTMPQIEAAFKQAHAYRRESRPLATELTLHALERAMMLGDEAHVMGKLPPADERLLDAMAFAEAHLTEPLSIEKLADVAGLSPSRFAHLFTAWRGESPMKFVEGLRIARAQSLLLATSDPIHEVAQSCGFDNPYHFATRFRRRTGQTPRDYRRQPKAADVQRRRLRE